MDWLVSGGNGQNALDLFSSVAWTFWCVNQRAGNVARIPYLILPVGVEGDDPDLAVDWGIDLRPLFWDVEAWLRLKGAAYVLKQLPEKLRTLNATTMRVKEYDSDGPTTFEQRVGAETILYSADELLYFRLFNPKDDIHEGVASGEVGSGPAQLIKYAGDWAAAFFKNGAMPAVILSTDGVVPPNERERIESRWKEMLQGVQRAWETLVLDRELKPTVIGQPIKDLAMPELEQIKKEQILAAHNMPPAIANPSLNKAEREELDEIFITHHIRPDVERWIEPVFNEQLFNPLGLRLSFQYRELEVLQKAELEKAEASSFFVTGMMLPAYEKNTVSVDEVRRVLDAVLQAAAPREIPAQLQQAPEGDEEEDGVEGAPTPVDERIEQRLPKALLDDLDRWERKAVTRIKEGYPRKALEFASDAIPVVMHRMIVHSLEHALTLGDVQEVFKAARGEKQIQFIPEGQGDPLPPVPAEVHITEADIDRAIRDWNKHMPDFVGLLDAEVIRRENYDDAEPVGLG
jgi:HK97 family phage portal protein